MPTYSFFFAIQDDNSDPRSISQHDETGSVLSLDPPFAKLEPILSESLILNQASSESISTERFPSQSVLSDSTILEPTPVESSLLRYALSRSLLDASSLRRPSHGQLLSDDGEYTRRNSLAAMTNSRPTSPFSLGLQHTSEYHGQGSGMHQNRFRRSSAPSRMRRNASRGSYRSQMSVRSMGSQVSFEEMDKYDAILQGIDDLVNDHIKRLRHTFWRQTPKPTRVLNDRCRESLVSFQQCITEYAVEDHEPISEAEDSQSLQLVLTIFQFRNSD